MAAEDNNDKELAQVDDENDEDPNYKVPAQKSLSEIQKLDADDPSLVNYKKTLLGEAVTETPFPDNPNNVIPSTLSLVVEGREDFTIDLKTDAATLKKHKIVIKEGAKYRLKITFYVQREIVTGLKYVQKTTRKGIKVDKTRFMLGSYAPNMKEQSYCTPIDDAPEGLLSRGSYSVSSTFEDDDKNTYLSWEWGFEIKKDWE